MPQLALVTDYRHAGPDPSGAWLANLRAGDPAAMAECYRQYADGMMALAYRLTGNTADAEDIVHDVFVGLPEALAKYEERGQFASWLKRVTARTALMYQRKSLDRRETPRDLDVFPTLQANADAHASNAGIRSAVTDALNALTPALRAVFVLKIVEGCSHSEIARTLNISTGSSEVRLNRAITKLRALLGGHAS